ncbi:hypothetical protein DL766_001225 [Monosporascus sp. MC13-8B]|nr:hypothetical protein DL763_002974 [Monosporascus cannonballus]RYP37928.1 hypothetical protein DL766_001225 [Monosporascus sp. MC13-8B]
MRRSTKPAKGTPEKPERKRKVEGWPERHCYKLNVANGRGERSYSDFCRNHTECGVSGKQCRDGDHKAFPGSAVSARIPDPEFGPARLFAASAAARSIGTASYGIIASSTLVKPRIASNQSMADPMSSIVTAIDARSGSSKLGEHGKSRRKKRTSGAASSARSVSAKRETGVGPWSVLKSDSAYWTQEVGGYAVTMCRRRNPGVKMTADDGRLQITAEIDQDIAPKATHPRQTIGKTEGGKPIDDKIPFAEP